MLVDSIKRYKNDTKEIKENVGINDTYIKIKNATAKGYLLAQKGDGIDISSRMNHHRGTVQKGKAQTITCEGGNNVGVVCEDNDILRIRKLTPLECCRLMDAPDDVDSKLKQAGLTDSQRYHIYGDGLIAGIVELIVKEMSKNI